MKKIAVLALSLSCPWLAAQDGDEPVLLSPREAMRQLEKKLENKGAAQEPAVDPVPAKGEPQDYPRIAAEEQGKIEVPAAAQTPEAPKVEVPANSAPHSADKAPAATVKEETSATVRAIMKVGGLTFIGGWLLAIVSAFFLSVTQAVVPLIFAGIGLALASWAVMYFAERVGPGGRGLGSALGNLGGLIGGFLLGGLLLGGLGALFGGLIGQAAGHLGGQAIENAVLGKQPEQPKKKN